MRLSGNRSFPTKQEHVFHQDLKPVLHDQTVSLEERKMPTLGDSETHILAKKGTERNRVTIITHVFGFKLTPRVS